uniref:Ig-like domain-containing protein n=1 Tax=Crocodylus porosus TaxID=8502 RepID=A0A7M4FZY2_CROPO
MQYLKNTVPEEYSFRSDVADVPQQASKTKSLDTKMELESQLESPAQELTLSTTTEESPDILDTPFMKVKDQIHVFEQTLCAQRKKSEDHRFFSPLPKTRIKIEKDGDTCILEICSIQKSEGGEYMCHAVNIIGEAKSMAQVEVLSQDGRSLALHPPVTHQHVMEFDLEQNTGSRSPSPQEILLEVELDENEVKEFEKQVKIVTTPEFNPDNKSLILSLDVLPLALVEHTDSLVAKGNKDVKIDFEVTEMPPCFTTPLVDLEIPEKSEAVFECAVTGTPTPVVQWFKGETCIMPAAGKYVVSDKKGHHSLIIQNVGYSDSGTYWCKATNSIGETVCKSSLVVTDWQKATTEASGEVLREVALSAAGSAPQKFNLLVDSAIPNGNQTEIELEFEFEHATDDSQKDCSFEFQVTEAPPRFIKHISDCNASEGASACFQCLVDGSPKPSVSWYKDGVSLQGERYFVEERQTGYHNLIIGNLIQSDAGEYKCMATNKAGAAETSAVLTIFSGKWEVGRGEPESAECARGLAAVFEYSVRGEPAPQVRWFRGNRQIFPSGSHTVLHHADGSGSLTVRECQGEDAGLYTCQAWSPLGEAACSAELRVVRDAPGAPPCAQPDVAAGDGNKIPPGKDYKIYFEDKTAALEIPLAKLKDSGHYVCTASNEAGSSSSSATVAVRGKAGAGLRHMPRALSEEGAQLCLFYIL